METTRIKLALEPEAASILCRFSEPDLREYLSKKGIKYLVADLGGKIHFWSKTFFYLPPLSKAYLDSNSRRLCLQSPKTDMREALGPGIYLSVRSNVKINMACNDFYQNKSLSGQ